MNETRLCSLEQLQAFLDATAEVQFLPCEGDDGRYAHLEAVLRRFGYRRLVRQFLDTGAIAKRYRSARERCDRREGRDKSGINFPIRQLELLVNVDAEALFEI